MSSLGNYYYTFLISNVVYFILITQINFGKLNDKIPTIYKFDVQFHNINNQLVLYFFVIKSV